MIGEKYEKATMIVTITGNVVAKSAMRISTVSNQPPNMPSIAPTSTPMPVASSEPYTAAVSL